MKIKNTIALFILIICGIYSSAYAAWPVVDVSAIAKLKIQIDQMKQQFDVLKKQYTELQATKDAVTGSYGVSNLANGVKEKATRRALPPTWQEVVSLQKSGFYGQRQDYFNKLLPSIDIKLLSPDPKNRNVVSYQMSVGNTQAAFAATEAIYNSIQNRLQTIESLTQEIDKTDNIKNSMDLNSRIAAENGFLNIDMARLVSLQLSLQANIQNNQNQATANHAEFFGGTIK